MAHTLGLSPAKRLLLLLLLHGATHTRTRASHQPSASHSDPVTPVVIALAIILAAAKLGGHLAAQVGQPAVLGELVAGVVLGSLDLAGISWFGSIERDPTVDILARLGVVILLFEVGLESTVRDMLKVGLPSLLVAVLGVAVPFALGWGVGALLLPEKECVRPCLPRRNADATSVGITARVLQDLGRSKTAEARVILGAAVIDDVLGLVILAVVGGMIAAADRGASLSAAKSPSCSARQSYSYSVLSLSACTVAAAVPHRIAFEWPRRAVGDGIDLLFRLGLRGGKRRAGANRRCVRRRSDP